jgi:hypothetical protein
MEQIIITHPNGSQTPLVSMQNASGITKAEQNVSLLADDIVNISVQSATPLPFVLGDTIEVYGKTYTLNQLPTIKKTGDRRFNYDLVFEGVQYELLDAQFLLPDDTISDSFTGTLFAFVQILVSNANRVFPGKWSVGEYPTETEYKTLTITGENCLSVLQRLCEEWVQEFEIVQSNEIRILHIRTAGANFPYTFRYGRTGGLYELTRQNINSKNVVTRLFVYGGSNNIPNSYITERNSSKLCLPDKNKNTSYIQNADAVAAFGLKENTKTFDDIFPNRYGEVTAQGTKYYAFTDQTMDFDLNEKDAQGNTLWLIAGVTAKVHFNTGNLAGYEFDLHKYDHATKTIEVVPFTDENGMKFPSETSTAFQFAPGDKYFFVDINLPDSYIVEAESKLSEAGEEYYAQNSQPQVQYSLQIDENFIKQFDGELTVVSLFVVGDYIPIQDTDIGVDKSVRITGFTRDLLKPYKYAITLGDAVTKSTLTRIIADQIETDRIIEINNLANPSKARRNWRASQEVLSMVFDPDGDYYSEKIKPLSIETTMLQVGAKSMQFVLQNVIFEPNYQGNPNYIRVGGGYLIHYNIPVDRDGTITDEIKTWNIAEYPVSSLVNDAAYYIYARCEKATNAGNIVLSTVQRKIDYESGYYTFMIGVLSSLQPDDNGLRPARLISLTYGSTTINGRFIKTGRIESSGGSPAYFDLDNGEIGGNIKFLAPDGGLMNVADLFDSLSDTQNYIDNNLQEVLQSLQNQVDGAIQYFFGTGEPTMSNYPVNTWDASEYDSHIGDIYTDTDTGYEYHFTKNGSTYSWTQAASTGVGQALQAANNALNLADKKNTVFITANFSTPPKAPYKVGDLWFILITYKFKVCKTENSNTGTSNVAHWSDVGYTDDTTANNALHKLSDMANDGIVTPQEKTALKDEWTQIQSDYAILAAQAGGLRISYADLTTAYNALDTYLNTTTGIFNDMSVNTSIDHTAFTNLFTAYYTERTKLVTQISQAQIDALNIGGQNYIKNSGYFSDLSGWQLNMQNSEGALTLYTGNQTHGSVLRLTKTGDTGWWVFGTGMESAGGNICLPQGKFISGIVYTVAFYVYCSTSVTFYVVIRNGDATNAVSTTNRFTTQSNQWQRVEFSFTANSASSNLSRLYITVDGSSASKTFSYAYFTKFVLCEGNKAPEWKTSEYDFQYAIQANKDVLTAINNNFTQIAGGLILSSFLKLGRQNANGTWVEDAGLKAKLNNTTNELAAYFGSTEAQAIAGSAPLAIYHNGKIVATNAEIRGTVNATDGEFNGKVSLANGKILLNKDGSGQLANGNISWDTNGNVTANNVILNNVTANSGTFKGAINAIGGIQMGSRSVSSSTQLTASDSFVIITGGTSYHSVTITLPTSPNQGQMITLFNKSDYEVLIKSTGSTGILPYQDDNNTAYLGRTRAKQFIYSPYVWYIVGVYDF